jgi:plasmid stabilization system protein ParE
MRHQIRFTQQALQDLRDIWRGCAEFSGLKVADKRHQAIKAKIKLLSQFPEAGRSRDEVFVGLSNPTDSALMGITSAGFASDTVAGTSSGSSITIAVVPNNC